MLGFLLGILRKTLATRLGIESESLSWNMGRKLVCERSQHLSPGQAVPRTHTWNFYPYIQVSIEYCSVSGVTLVAGDRAGGRTVPTSQTAQSCLLHLHLLFPLPVLLSPQYLLDALLRSLLCLLRIFTHRFSPQ